MTDNCANCRYWVHNITIRGSWRATPLHVEGACKRHAPTYPLIVHLQGQSYGLNEGKWPTVKGEDWCGDHSEFVNSDQ